MTYAYLNKYSPSTTKRGFYIDGPNWTLQTTSKADRFFRQSTRYHDDTQLPLTVVKTLVHLGEAKTGDRTQKEEILSWLPKLSPRYCDMDSNQLNELQTFIEESLEDSRSVESESSVLISFLRDETPIDPSFLH
jgi:hypothetical protein